MTYEERLPLLLFAQGFLLLLVMVPWFVLVFGAGGERLGAGSQEKGGRLYALFCIRSLFLLVKHHASQEKDKETSGKCNKHIIKKFHFVILSSCSISSS